MHLVQLLYASEPINGTTQSDVDKIIETSKTNNPKNGISGVMYYNRKCYFQCLEGGRQAVNQLYAKIVQDNRHTNSRLFLFHDINRRDFSEWSMNYIGEGILNHDIFYKHSTTHELNFDQMSGNSALAMLRELTEYYKSHEST